MLDSQDGKSPRVDQLGVVPVVSLVLVKDMAECIPVRGALNAECQRVVGVANLVPVLLARNSIGASRQHLVNRIESPAEQAGLRPGTVERNAKCEYFTGADQAGRLDDVLRRDVVEGANLVFFAPASPILELLRSFGDRLFADLDPHEVLPSGFLNLAVSNLPPTVAMLVYHESMGYPASTSFYMYCAFLLVFTAILCNLASHGATYEHARLCCPHVAPASKQ